MDVWLKNQIKDGIKKIINCSKESWQNYYTGHLHKDILENFPGKSSKKIFKGFRELLDNKNLLFYQKKFGEHSYEYYVRKVNNEKTR